MHHLPIPDNAARQFIDSITIFTEYRRVQQQAAKYAGSMYWKEENGYQYLVKTRPGRRSQERLGVKSEATERIFNEYTSHKQATTERLQQLHQALIEAERLNKALKVGRVPNLVIEVLQALSDAGLSQHFTVVGTHALYAYEMAAGVRIVQRALATQDVDLLWDARRRVQFMADIAKLDTSILKILQRADKSFQRKEGRIETAINASGFEVDFLRRQPVENDIHPFRFSSDEDDLWPIQALRASVLTSAPKFSHVVVASNGKMALMETIAPQAFIEFKQWLATEAPERAAIKRSRDKLQAQIVQDLIEQRLLQS